MARRVAVTGVGVVAPCGIGADSFWAGLCSDPPEPVRDDSGSLVRGRRVEDFDPAPLFASPKEARRTDRVTQMALAATTEALEQAGDIQVDPLRRGVLVATGIGGITTLDEQVRIRLEKGERRVSPFLVPMMMVNSSSAAVSMRWGWEGPCQTQSTACAAGTHAIVDAAGWIRHGRCDAVIAGGTEAAMTPTSIAGFANMTALSSSGRSMPFAAERDGFVISEGAAILVLEEWSIAEAQARRSSPKCWAAPLPLTRTTSPRLLPAAAARSLAWSWHSMTPGSAPRISLTSTPTAPRRH